MMCHEVDSCFYNRVVREGLFDEVIFEQRFGEVRESIGSQPTW